MPKTLLHDDKPTRALRVKFAVRKQPEKQFAISLYEKTITELAGVIEGRKHPLEINPAKALLPIALTVQGFLLFPLTE